MSGSFGNSVNGLSFLPTSYLHIHYGMYTPYMHIHACSRLPHCAEAEGVALQ